REKVVEGPGVNAASEHPLHARRASPFHEERGESLAGEGQGGGRTRGAGSHDDGVKTLHGPASRVGKAGRVKGFPRNSQRTQGPQLELATSMALGLTGRVLAEALAVEGIPSEAGEPSRQALAHGFLRAPVGPGDWAVGH